MAKFQKSKTQRVRQQVTCRCHKYSFPHRLGGGKCTGSEWAQSYRFTINTECKRCACCKKSSCDVADGAEDIGYCEGFQDVLHRQVPIRLPADENRLYVREDVYENS